jgi:ABC transport system ATP-binding/permease protein
MNYLSLENITWYYGEKCLFDGIFLHIDKGQKTALVAKNGAGKSTLLRIAAGLEQVKQDDAKVELHPEARVVFLDQAPSFNTELSILDTVLDSQLPALKAIRDYEYAIMRNDNTALKSAALAMDNHQAWETEASMKELLDRMQLSDPEQLVGSLSGGQQKRLALVKALLPSPDFIILDEPTNHLDIEMIEWLENYLSREQLTLLMVTHDRYFLDRVCNQIYELDRGKLHRYKGNYSDFLESKATRHVIEQRTFDKNQRLFDSEREWVSRMPKARTTKSKARVDQFDQLREHLRNKPGDKSLQLSIKQERLGKKIVELYNVGYGYDDKNLFEKLEYKFKKGERLGIAGPNGSGKTTLLKILTGELQPKQGRIVVGDTIKIGHYAQEWKEQPTTNA